MWLLHIQRKEENDLIKDKDSWKIKLNFYNLYITWSLSGALEKLLQVSQAFLAWVQAFFLLHPNWNS